MKTLHTKLEGRRRRPAVSVDSKHLLRPEQLARQRLPAETTGLAQLLRARQDGFAASQFGGLLQHFRLELGARLAELELPPAQGGLGSPPSRDAPTDGECRERERQEAGQIEEPREQRIVHLDQPRHDQRGEQRGQESRADTAEPGGGDHARLEEPGWMNERRRLRTGWNRSDERNLERHDEGDTEEGQRIPQGRGSKTFTHGCAAVSAAARLLSTEAVVASSSATRSGAELAGTGRRDAEPRGQAHQVGEPACIFGG